MNCPKCECKDIFVVQDTAYCYQCDWSQDNYTYFKAIAEWRESAVSEIEADHMRQDKETYLTEPLWNSGIFGMFAFLLSLAALDNMRLAICIGLFSAFVMLVVHIFNVIGAIRRDR